MNAKSLAFLPALFSFIIVAILGCSSPQKAVDPLVGKWTSGCKQASDSSGITGEYFYEDVFQFEDNKQYSISYSYFKDSKCAEAYDGKSPFVEKGKYLVNGGNLFTTASTNDTSKVTPFAIDGDKLVLDSNSLKKVQ